MLLQLVRCCADDAGNSGFGIPCDVSVARYTCSHACNNTHECTLLVRYDAKHKCSNIWKRTDMQQLASRYQQLTQSTLITKPTASNLNTPANVLLLLLLALWWPPAAAAAPAGSEPTDAADPPGLERALLLLRLSGLPDIG